MCSSDLKNPAFNGMPALETLAERRGEPRAMAAEQVDLFAEPEEERRITEMAQMLEQKRLQREAQEKATPVTAMGEAFKAAQERQKTTLEPVTAPETAAAPAAPV